MKELKIYSVNNLPYDSRLFADGKEILLKKNKNGVSSAVINTESDAVELRVENFSCGRLPFFTWLWQTLICWIVSVFGIFDSVNNKNGRAVDVRIKVNVHTSSFVKLKFNLFKSDVPACEIVDADAETDVTENRYYIDYEAKKRNKIYKIWRILSVITLIAALIFIMIIGG